MMKQNTQKQSGRSSCWRGILFLAIMLTVAVFFYGCSLGDGQSDQASLQSEEDLTAYFLDVGQADSTLLVSQGEAVLIDAGNRDDAEFILGYIKNLGIDHLKYVIFTHPHEDHIGSGRNVLQQFGADTVYMLDGYDSGIAGSLKQSIDQLGIQTKAPTPGDTAAFGECEIQFLGPYEKYNDTNDNSICLKVKHGETSMLFTGDAGSSPEKKMIEMGEDLEADLLQAGHHGSSTSNSYYFLREANPEYVVISCGKGNMYGHPHEEALSRFRDLGAEVFRTDEQGTIIAVDDGMQIRFNCEGKKSDRTHVKDYEDASYIGNINSKKYHLPSCSGLPNEENRVYFTTIDAAETAGYSPCGNCHPDQ